MKRNISFICIVCLLLFCFIATDTANAITVKWLRIGRYWRPVADSGDEGEGNIGWNQNGFYYYGAFEQGRSMTQTKGVFIAAKSFTDTTGKTWAPMVSGHGQWSVDEATIMMPIPDDDGFTLRMYRRYHPPEIYVDDYPLHDPFPRDVDEEVNPNIIPGTAEAMLASTIRLNMGIEIKQKVLAWDEKNHDDYIMYDWTFTNTGNADFDDEIEYPDQTLEGIYSFKQLRVADNWGYRNWTTKYGQLTTDTLRLLIGYPELRDGIEWDEFGCIEDPISGKIQDPHFWAEAILYTPTSATDPTHDPSQPRMSGVQDCDLPFACRHPGDQSQSDWSNMYQTCEEGLAPYDGTPEMDHPDLYPNTHHSIKFDERGYKYITDYENLGWSLAHHYAIGPYTLEPGESFRIVWADVVGSISYDKGWEVGKAWAAGNSEVTVPYPGPDNLTEKYTLFPDLAPTENDKNKDRWVFSSRDSLHMNAHAATFAFNSDYDVPEAPPAPSIRVSSKPDKILIEWNYDHLTVSPPSDLAGYRVYRSTGIPDSTWELIEEYGTGTNSHEDTDVSRAYGYYYAVCAYDDGTSNAVGVKGVREVQESGLYLNRTTLAAYLTRVAGSLDKAVIVPNPFNINAASLQYIGQKDKIMFLDIPGYCVIDIYTESGDHMQTIEHLDGSGDQSWGVLTEEFQTTKSQQIPVSGLYIARIEETDEQGKRTGNSKILKFLIVR